MQECPAGLAIAVRRVGRYRRGRLAATSFRCDCKFEHGAGVKDFRLTRVHPTVASARSAGRSPPPSLRKRAGPEAWVAAAFVIVCFLLGGNSRFQLLPHLTLRLVSIGLIGYALWRMTPKDRVGARPFALAVVAYGALMAAQLIPLPPGIWDALPGHGFYAEALRIVGLNDRWRPLSMAPDLTLDSLLSLLPALAAALLFAPLDGSGRRLLLDILLVCLGIGALLAVLQLVSGGYYPYPKNNEGTGVGFFANRNHQALFLATGIVLILGRWRLAGRRIKDLFQVMIVLGTIGVIFMVLIVTGSRAGLVAGVISFLVGGLVLGRGTITGQPRWRRFAIPGAALGLVVIVFAIGMASTRQVAVQRLLQTGSTITTTELRTANLPALIETSKAFMPLGSGFGTFDAVFRRFESDALLRPTFFNHAHSEPIELLIEGGVPAAILLVVVLVWLARRSVILARSAGEPAVIRAQIGIIGLLLLLLGSLADYPLRTPFLGILAILFATWAAERGIGQRDAVLGTVAGLE